MRPTAVVFRAGEKANPEGLGWSAKSGIRTDDCSWYTGGTGLLSDQGPNRGGQAGLIRGWTEVTRNIVFNNQAVVSAVGATQAAVGG
jgi:hypothetical protein